MMPDLAFWIAVALVAIVATTSFRLLAASPLGAKVPSVRTLALA